MNILGEKSKKRWQDHVIAQQVFGLDRLQVLASFQKKYLYTYVYKYIHTKNRRYCGGDTIRAEP